MSKEVNEIKEINEWVKSQLDIGVIHSLTDESLIHEYKKTKSVQREIQSLYNVMKAEDVDEQKINAVVERYISQLIPPSVKSVIRGNLFNKIVRERLLQIYHTFLNKGENKEEHREYEVDFEKKVEQFPTNEIPDWYILHRPSGRVMVGMNQMDLWGGGHQYNRGGKYILDQVEEQGKKIVCVVCNDVEVKTKQAKVYHILSKGIKQQTLCYLKGLEKVILHFFT